MIAARLPLALAAFALACTLPACDAADDGALVSFVPVENASALRVESSGTTVFTDAAAWAAFWRAHVNAWDGAGVPLPVPEVDFARRTVVAVFWGGELHTGCTSDVDVFRDVREEDGALRVRVTALPDLGVCRAIVHPLQVIAVERAGQRVRFEGRVPG